MQYLKHTLLASTLLFSLPALAYMSHPVPQQQTTTIESTTGGALPQHLFKLFQKAQKNTHSLKAEAAASTLTPPPWLKGVWQSKDGVTQLLVPIADTGKGDVSILVNGLGSVSGLVFGLDFGLLKPVKNISPGTYGIYKLQYSDGISTQDITFTRESDSQLIVSSLGGTATLDRR